MRYASEVLRRLSLVFVVALAACGDDAAPVATQPRDPQVAQALNDPLMTDPDLSSRNEGAAALTVESDFSQPVLPATPEEIAAAKAAAAVAVGGVERLRPLGEPERAANGSFAHFIDAACRQRLQRSAIWAARLPASTPIYPRGHTATASGSDAPECRVREVTYTTPVSPADVIAFHAAMARRSGQPASYARAGDDLSLAGGGGSLHFEVRVRAEGDHSLVRIATRER
jgi:hypothetical protein